ncbi:MAG: peptide deformylase [Desulfobacteraceae bacterium]|nr:peptide deformylase [Desulfobacteraceae bacterium]MBC2755782.1 peptide deformylase [Desulfobacteraceae bacterium]
MTLLKILTYPDPFLREPTKPVADIDDEIQTIIEDMAETMYEAPGVGLAAIQAGIDKSIIVYDPDADVEKKDFHVLINPEIVFSEGEMVSENEGCLSVPDLRADVKRSEKVTVEALDRNGNPLKIEAVGLLSVILQHEIDHLKGILFIDRISALKRQLYKKKRRKALKSEPTV